MIVEIHNFDGNPPPQGASEPMRVTLVWRFSTSPDGSEYWLAEPVAPISYLTRDGEDITVTHVILGPGWVGQTFQAGFEGRVNLAYVTDPSLVDQEAIEFSKADYVAFGHGSIAA